MSNLKHTPLHDAHLSLGAKMVDFGGWHMPLQYQGILAEHKAVREAVGIFDVSHMGEIDFRGAGAFDAVQYLITNDLQKIGDDKALYTALCRPDGGIVDDCIVYRFSAEHFRIVVNASNIEKDFAHFQLQVGDRCELSNRSDEFALIAVQGPKARAMVAELGAPSVLDIESFHLAPAQVAGVEVVAARTGYTGEDGFELFVPAEVAPTVWKALVDAGAQPIGLGARDTLRLEARLCLYGNDIDENTSPLEAGLGWVVKPDASDFVGRAALVEQKTAGVGRKLVGFRVTERGIARPGAEVVDGDTVIGQVTSGGPAPTVGGAVGMAYVPIELATPGQTITIRQRRKSFAAEIVKGPFYRRS